MSASQDISSIEIGAPSRASAQENNSNGGMFQTVPDLKKNPCCSKLTP